MLQKLPVNGRPGVLALVRARRDELRLDLRRRAESRVIEGDEILFHRPAGRRGIARRGLFVALDRALPVGVGLDQARIDGEAFAPDQAGSQARFNDALEDSAEEAALTEPLITGA